MVYPYANTVITEKDISKARELAEKKTGYYNRPWTVAIFNEKNRNSRIEFHVMLGSPAKAYLIVNYGNMSITVHQIKCIHQNKILKRYTFEQS